MSKEVIWKCNLCCEPKPKEQIMAFYWHTSKYVLVHELDASGRHICKTCYNTIVSQEKVFDKVQDI